MFVARLIGLSRVLMAPVLCCVLMLCSSPVIAEPFKFCFEQTELFPFYTGEGREAQKDKPGVMVELMQLADSANDDITLQFYRAPWKRCLNNLATGDYHGVIGTFDPQRESFGVYPKSDGVLNDAYAITSIGYCLFVHQDALLSWAEDGFKGEQKKPLAVPRGYSIVPILKEKELLLDITSSSDIALDLFRDGRVDAVVTLCLPGKKRLKENGGQQFLKQVHNILPQQSYLIISKQFYQESHQRSWRIWDSLKTVKDNHYDTLMSRYSDNNAISEPDRK